MSSQKFKILILGGGSGGISVAARLVRMGFAGQIGIVEPSACHYYQPYWTLAGVGLVSKESSCRSMTSVIPAGAEWIKDSVQVINPESHTVETSLGRVIAYDVLVVALGLDLNFEKIQGVTETLGQHGVISVYRYDQLEASVDTLQRFKGGTAIFTMPPVPIKCAGAPQKVMYLADAIWRQKNIRAQTKVIFATAGATIFGIKEFADALMQVVKRKEIEVRFQNKLVAVNGPAKKAIFETNVNGVAITEEVSFDLLHVVPPMSAPKMIQNSILASTDESQRGWLAVDKFTLQHPKFANVFGVGDVTGIPNSKTGAAVRKQAPVVAENIRRLLSGSHELQRYDGYSSCPLITDIGKVILAEFGYNGTLMPSFPLDPTKERRIYWHLKKDLLPPMYWYGMLRGRM